MTDSIHTIPLSLHFGPRGMCAAVGLTPDEFTAAYRTGQIAARDTVHLREPRWPPCTLRNELAKQLERAGVDPKSLDGLGWQAERVACATQAEGW